jgi:hypothetical protein
MANHVMAHQRVLRSERDANERAAYHVYYKRDGKPYVDAVFAAQCSDGNGLPNMSAAMEHMRKLVAHTYKRSVYEFVRIVVCDRNVW